MGRVSIAQRRWYVHVALVGLFILSLLAIWRHAPLYAHVLVGLGFGAFVLVHLGQRRRVVASLARQLGHWGGWLVPRDRLALADVVLVLITLNVMVSGTWDYLAGGNGLWLHLGVIPPMRWHALSAVALLAYLAVHVARRARRLRSSTIR